MLFRSFEALVRVTTDAKFVCPSRDAARALAAAPGAAPVWRYFFTHRLDNLQRRQAWAAHGLELPFVFRKTNVGGYRPSADELALVEVIDAAWASLARAGDPATADQPWPSFTPDADAYLQLEGGDVGPLEGVRTEDCDFWAGQAPPGGQIGRAHV